MPGMALSLCEREKNRVYLTEDPAMSWAEIARWVDRPPTTIAREVNRNGDVVATGPLGLIGGLVDNADGAGHRCGGMPTTSLTC